MANKVIIKPSSYSPEALPFGGVSPNGERLEVNSRYFIRNGTPWYPIMGEFHFSRFTPDDWEREILKMKAGGVDIIATYVFWIHHEEEKGVFDFSGCRDLARFIELCEKNGMYIFLRIGPWCHGECRNGGFPDWLVAEKEVKKRSNDPVYLSYVDRLFEKIGEIAAPHMWEKGGRVIGIQLENEYRGGEPDIPRRKLHLIELKKLAIKHGMSVPFYTATAWGGGTVADMEMLPVMGGYCDAPWRQDLKEMPESIHYLMRPSQNDPMIGSDLKRDEENDRAFTCEINRYPFLTAELGGGMQPTEHRRVVAFPKDIEGLAFCKLASGANLLGYYMYHGGTNPEGKLSTLQESRATGYPNDVPVKSYDFECMIGEWGIVHESYGRTKRIHMLTAAYGDIIARSENVVPEWSCANTADLSTIRLSVRHDYESGSGFVFINNHLRKRTLAEHNGFKVTVETPNGTVDMPEVDVKDGDMLIMPYMLKLGDATLKASNASPLTKIGKRFFFYTDSTPVYEFCGETRADIVTLTDEESRNAYLFGDKLYIAPCTLFEKNGKIYAELTESADIKIYGETGTPVTIHCEYTPCKATCTHVPLSDSEYELTFHGLEGEGEYFATLDYLGDKAELYDGDKMVSDWFTTGQDYSVSLTSLGTPNKLKLVIRTTTEPRYYDIYPSDGCGLRGVRMWRKSIHEING